jgi:hypothetical protein
MPSARPNPVTFEAEILGRGPNGAWAYVRFPFEALEIFGRKGQIAVRGAINGFAYRNSLMPRGDGSHILGVSKELQQGANAVVGDIVTITLEFDDAPREVVVPADLQSSLKKSGTKAEAFEALSYSHRKEFVDWIESAKRPETRAARIEKTIVMLAERKTPKG